MLELNDLIISSIRDIRELYSVKDSLDRSWQGTLIITIAQYLCAYHYKSCGKQIPSKSISTMYESDPSLSEYVKNIIDARNDVCHRSGMEDTNDNLRNIISDRRMEVLLSRHHIITIKKDSSFTVALKMSGE